MQRELYRRSLVVNRSSATRPIAFPDHSPKTRLTGTYRGRKRGLPFDEPAPNAEQREPSAAAVPRGRNRGLYAHELPPNAAAGEVQQAARAARQLRQPVTPMKCTNRTIIETAMTFNPCVNAELELSPVKETVQRSKTIFQLFQHGNKGAVVQTTPGKFGSRENAIEAMQVLQLLHANGSSKERLNEVKQIMCLSYNGTTPLSVD